MRDGPTEDLAGEIELCQKSEVVRMKGHRCWKVGMLDVVSWVEVSWEGKDCDSKTALETDGAAGHDCWI